MITRKKSQKNILKEKRKTGEVLSTLQSKEIINFVERLKPKEQQQFLEYCNACENYNATLTAGDGIISETIKLGGHESQMGIQLKFYAETLEKYRREEELCKITKEFSESLKQISTLRYQMAGIIETKCRNKVKRLLTGGDMSTKDSKEFSKEVNYQIKIRDWEYYNYLKTISQSYLSFFEQGTKSMKEIKSLLDELDKENKYKKPIRIHKIFAVPLSKLSTPIPLIILSLMEYIEKYYLTTEGIFRVSGSKKCIDDLKKKIDDGLDEIDELISIDVENKIHTHCGLLKLYIREIPESLFGKLGLDFIKVEKEKTNFDDKISGYKILIGQLPKDNRYVLARLIRLFEKVKEVKENEMDHDSIAIVFAMNLFRIDDPVFFMNHSKYINGVLSFFILNGKALFPPNLYSENYYRYETTIM